MGPFVLVLAAVAGCVVVECGTQPSNYCVTFGNPAVVASCKNSSDYCPITKSALYMLNTSNPTVECVEIPPAQEENLRTGFPCSTNSSCVTNKCIQGNCQGYFYREQCLKDSDCSPNMYCKPNSNNDFGTCAIAFTQGQDCDFDNQCATGLGCSRGSCVAMFSLSIGTLTDEAYFCTTFLRNLANRCDAIEVYINNKKLSSPYQCVSGDKCVYKYQYAGTVFDTQSCRCDGTGTNNGYCSHYIRYIQNIAEDGSSNLAYTTGNCAGDDASSYEPDILYACQSIDLTQYAYYLNWTNVATYWNFYQSHVIDSCALSVGLFDPNFVMNTALGIMTGLIAIISLY
jgi:hypothetical protein